MSTLRESWFECHFASSRGEWVRFVRSWNAAMAEALFREELGTLAQDGTGTIRVVRPGAVHPQPASESRPRRRAAGSRRR